MTEIRFYHLQTRTQDQTLPVLLSKAYEQGKRIIVKMRNKQEVTALDKQLWVFNPNSFLPHGSAGTTKEKEASLQPIWLTDIDENPNNADVLMVGHGVSSEMYDDFSLCCKIFDGHDSEAVAQAREDWQTYKDRDFEVTYWQQDERGGWSKR
ncbi:MAG: DNA polymerase III subunit chi [Alphaproteobacteria bacterium]|nr:DNA polymerase III subunit chi [Alphaproteobacteria bacterium]